jgi:hypothetical protein
MIVTVETITGLKRIGSVRLEMSYPFRDVKISNAKMGDSAIMAFAKKLIMDVLAKNVRKAFDVIRDSALSKSMKPKNNFVNPWALIRINFTVVSSKSIGASEISRDPIFVDIHGLVFSKISLMNAVLALLANSNFIMKALVPQVRRSVLMSNNV